MSSIDDFLNGADEPAQSQTTALDNFLSGADEESAVRQTLTAVDGLGLTPDQAAEAKALSKKTGIPAVAVESILPEVKQKAEFIDLVEASKKHPEIAKILSNYDVAKITKDDVGALTRVADTARALPGGAVQSVGQGIAGLGRLQDMAMRRTNDGLRAMGFENLADINTAIGYAINPSTQKSIIDIARGDVTAVSGIRPISAEVKKTGDSIEAVGQAINAPQDRQTIATDISSGLGQIASQIAMTLVNPALTLPMMIGQGAEIQGDRVDEAGKQGTASGDAAILMGSTVTAVTEKLGLDALLKRIPPNIKNSVLRQFSDVAAAGGIEALQEVAEGVLQNVITQQMVNPDQKIMEGWDRDAIAAGGAGAIARGLINAVTRGRSMQSQKDSADQAVQNADGMNQLVESVLATKTLPRDPETMKAFLNDISARTGQENLYVPAEKLIEYFQSQNIDPYQVPGINAQDLASADATGGDVAISMADYVTDLAPEHHAGLYSFVRPTEESWTLEESERFNASEENMFSQENEAIIADMEREQAEAEPADRVFSDVRDQLVAAGRVPDVADKEATAMKAFFRTMSKRLGRDAWSLYEENKPTFQRFFERPALNQRFDNTEMFIEEARSYFKKQDQSKKRSMANRVTDLLGRTQKREKATPRPLVNYFADMGGIDPTGKIAEELRSMDITPKTTPRLFRVGGRRDIDNIPASEFNSRFAESDLTAEEDGNGYVSRDFFLDMISRETMGDYIRTPEQRTQEERVAQYDDFRNYLGNLGLDYDSSNAEIRAAIEKDQAAQAAEDAMYQDGQVNTDSDAFAKWFGESKVVDDSGKPLVVYHGGFEAGKIEEFSRDYGGQTTGNNEHGAFHFTDSYDVAEDYSRQSFNRRFQDDTESLVDEGLATELPEFSSYEDQYAFVGEIADKRAATDVQAVYVKIENPIILDMEGERIDVGQIERLSRFAMTGIDENGEFDEYIDLVRGEYDPQEIEDYREDIETRARENNGLDDGEAIEDYQFREAVEEVLSEYGFEPSSKKVDGIIIRNMVDDIGDKSRIAADQFIIFDPENVKSIKNRGTFDANDPRILYQSVDQAADGLRSVLVDAVDGLKQAKGSGQQMLAALKNIPGVKEEEIAWTGLDDFLKGKTSVTKDEISAYLAENQVRIEEVTLGGGVDPITIEDFEREDIAEEDAEMEVTDRWRWTVPDVLLDQVEYATIDEYANGEVYEVNLSGNVVVSAKSLSETLIRLQKYLEDNVGIRFDGATGDRPTKFGQYTLPGGENYREVLLTLPLPDTADNFTSRINEEETDYAGEEVRDIVKPNGHVVATIPATEVGAYIRNEILQGRTSTQPYRSSHFDQPNILAHVRLNDRIDADGKRVLFVEEIQSDWHQAGRKKGYKIDKSAADAEIERMLAGRSFQEFQAQDPDGYQKALQLSRSALEGVPDAPFKKSWHEMAFRRVAQMAAQGNYDRIAWTTGEQQNDRFDLSKSVKQIITERAADGSITLKAYDLNDNKAINQTGLKESQIEDYVGKDVAAKIVKELDESKAAGSVTHRSDLRGLDLKVGGEGMKGFYDNILVKYAGKFGKKFGTAVGETDIKTDSSIRSLAYFMDWAESNGSIMSRPALSEEWSKGKNSELVKRFEAETKDTKVHSLDITPEMRESAQRGFELFQRNQDGKRGSYSPTTNVITFFQSADLSTFLHESGHYWLELMGKFSETASKKIANKDSGFPGYNLDDKQLAGLQSIVKDYNAILKHVGARPGQTLTTKQHEKFARTVEAYFMEGKSPSIELQGAMQRFKEWMISVYKDIKNLRVNITPEIRGVLDRMLATEEQIAEQERYSKYEMVDIPEATVTERAALQLLHDAATDESQRILLVKAMEPIRRERERWYKNEWRALAEKIEAEILDRPVWKAMEALRGSDGMDPIKINLKELEASFGQGIRGLLPRGITAEKAGIDPEVAAEMLGYASARKLIEDLSEIRGVSVKQIVKAETDARMAEIHGDIMNDGSIEAEARDAVHNEKRGDGIAMELKILRRQAAEEIARKAAERRIITEGAQDPQTYASEAAVAETGMERLLAETTGKVAKFARSYDRAGKSELNRATVDIKGKVIRHAAKALLGRRKVKFAGQVAQFARGEIKYADLSRKAIVERDYEAAAFYKYRQLLNHYLYIESKAMQKEFEKASRALRPLTRPDSELGKGYSIDHMTAGKFVMSRMGLLPEGPIKPGGEPYDALDLKEWRDSLSGERKSELMMFDTIADVTTAYKEMTSDQYRDVISGLKNLMHVSRGTKNIQLGQERINKEEAISDMNAAMDEYLTVRGKHKGDDDGLAGFITGAKATNRRVEFWARQMDKRDTNGVFHKYLVRPIQDAVGVYRDNKVKRLGEVLAIVEPFRKDWLKNRKIEASELIDQQTGSRFVFENKGQIIHALLHTGNSSNRNKLLGGYGWGRVDENGDVDSAAWRRFIQRMSDEGVVTKADMDAVQAVWDLFDSMKVDAQKAHKQMYGYNFAEITAELTTTPWGEYRGGYAPALIDRNRSIDGGKRNADDVMDDMQMANVFPTTGRGFTKGRNDAYRQPLELNLALVPSHVDKVLRFSFIEPSVKEVAKLVTDRRFKQKMQSFNPRFVDEALVPWLQRTARQVVETPAQTKTGREVMRVISAMRKRTGMQFIAGNITNTLQQVTGFSTARQVIGKGRLMRSLVNYTFNHGAVTAEVMSKSTFMRNRTGGGINDLMSNINEILTKPSKLKDLQRIADAHGYFLQSGFQRVIDTTVWMAGYDKAIEQGMSEKDAIFAADNAVRISQGSFAPEDIATVEAGTALSRMFTQFLNYFNTVSNLNVAEYETIVQEVTGKKRASQLFALYAFGFLIPSVLAEAIVQGVKGELGDEEDDGYLDDMAELFFGSQIRFALASVPIAGALGTASLNLWNNKFYDDRLTTSPSISALEGAVRAPKSLWDAIANDGDISRAVKDVGMAIGLGTGLPVYQLVSKPVGYLIDIAEGDARPQGVVDVTQGLITGRDGTN
jgi:hypothetical protein